VKRTSKQAQPQTTAQQLGSIVKSSRDIMRKGLRGHCWLIYTIYVADIALVKNQADSHNKASKPANQKTTFRRYPQMPQRQDRPKWPVNLMAFRNSK